MNVIKISTYNQNLTEICIQYGEILLGNVVNKPATYLNNAFVYLVVVDSQIHIRGFRLNNEEFGKRHGAECNKNSPNSISFKHRIFGAAINYGCTYLAVSGRELTETGGG